MKTVRRKIKNWKVLTVACALPLFFFVVACQDQVVSELNETTISQVTEYPAEAREAIAKLQEKYPGAKFNYVEGATDEVQKLFMDHPDQKNMVLQSFNFPEREVTGVLTVDISKYDLKDAKGVFTIVEEAAEPKGGIPELYQVIAKNMQYPEQARKMGVEGRVFVEFVVNEDGTLSDMVVLKGIGAGCDKEAMRVVAMSPAWTPAKQKGKIVKQRFVLPVVFKLG